MSDRIGGSKADGALLIVTDVGTVKDLFAIIAAAKVVLEFNFISTTVINGVVE